MTNFYRRQKAKAQLINIFVTTLALGSVGLGSGYLMGMRFLPDTPATFFSLCLAPMCMALLGMVLFFSKLYRFVRGSNSED